MLSTEACAAAVLLGSMACLGALARQAPASAPPQRRNYYAFNEIHVDQNCRILPDPARTPPGKKPRPYTDSNLCHLESVNASEHVEEKIVGSRLLRNLVDIQEHEFVLWNPADQPVTFVVEQFVPRNWTVDSDPQPRQIIGQTAFFPVQVQPGETVRLHVGMRHTSPMRAKTIATRSPRPAGAAATPAAQVI